jgi:large subunit ribosomal protein L25
VLRDVTIEAQPRELSGKRSSRKLARRGLIPGILYGGVADAQSFQIDPRKLDAILHSESGSNTLFTIALAGENPKTLAMIKAVQQDPVTGNLIHADLLRISMDRAIQVKVPVHIIGTARGVKQQGGILDFVLREIEVSCLPGDIPERLDADVNELDLGKAVKVADLKVSEKVKVLTDPNKAVAVVVAPAAEKAEAAAVAETTAEAPTEPEVIKKGKAETAEGAAEGEAGKGAEKGAKASEAKPGKAEAKGAKEKPEKGGKEKGGKEKGPR